MDSTKCASNRRSFNRTNKRFFLAFFLLFCVYLAFEMANDESSSTNSKRRHRFNLRRRHFKFNDNNIDKMSLIDFFEIEENDAGKVIWSHAVNSQQKLSTALADETMVLEADIIYVDTEPEPIMAHPPLQHSDITFSQWLNLSLTSGKALKLDFKTSNAIEPCLRLLRSMDDQIKVPVILNADIWKGINAPDVQINANYFLQKCLEFYPKGVMSLGWTSFNDASGSYSWENVYEAFDLLKVKNNIQTEITFAIRMQWAVNSLFRLVWLQQHTNCTFTIWSHDSDRFTAESVDSTAAANDRLLLFRYFFSNHLIYYDLAAATVQLNAILLKSSKEAITEQLNNSDDLLVRSYLLNEFRFEPTLWSYSKEKEKIYESDFASVMFQHGAKYISRKEYKAEDNLVIYEVHSAFEMFEYNSSVRVDSSESDTLTTTTTAATLASNNSVGQNDEKDNIAVAVDSKIKANTVSGVKISIRGDSTDLNQLGSINFFVGMNGLVKIYKGNKLDQEANIQPSNKFEYFITDVGESKAVHFDLNSYDTSTGQRYSLQMLVNANYHEGQQFFVTQTLLGNSHGIGIDSFKISDEISDPQDRDSNENQNNN